MNLPAMQETPVQSLGWEDPRGGNTPVLNSMDRGAWRAVVHGVTELDRTEHLTLPHTEVFCFYFFFFFLQLSSHDFTGNGFQQRSLSITGSHRLGFSGWSRLALQLNPENFLCASFFFWSCSPTRFRKLSRLVE